VLAELGVVASGQQVQPATAQLIEDDAQGRKDAPDPALEEADEAE
jgi:hypothetical protein